MASRDSFEIFAILKKKISSTESDISELQEFVSQILPGYDYKGSVNSYNDLPNDATTGDLYTVKNENYAQYAWDGVNWIMPSFPTITEAQINSLF